MKYEDLRRLSDKVGISTTEIAKRCNMTYDGFKRGFESQGLAMRCIPEICRSLQISPNMLFDYKKEKTDISIENAGTQNTQVQNINAHAPETLQALQEQLSEKDRQIAKLLDIIATKTV